jgi:death on curing protein
VTRGGRSEPKWLTVPMLLAIHARQVERYGGSHGILDENVAHSALARAENRWAYDEACDLADLASAYLVGFARTQGFNDGNKRTALACSLVFLRLNGYAVHVPGAEIYALTMKVALGEIGDDVVAAWFREKLEARQG